MRYYLVITKHNTPNILSVTRTSSQGKKKAITLNNGELLSTSQAMQLNEGIHTSYLTPIEITSPRQITKRNGKLFLKNGIII